MFMDSLRKQHFWDIRICSAQHYIVTNIVIQCEWFPLPFAAVNSHG